MLTDISEEQEMQKGTKVHILSLYNVDLNFSLMLFKNPLMMSKLISTLLIQKSRNVTSID